MWAWGFSFLFCLLTVGFWWRMRSALRAQGSAVRLLRLAARDMRAVGTSLHGLSGARGDAGLGVAAAQILATADTMQMHAPGAPLVLRDETVDLTGTIAEAVTAASATLAPGKRLWRQPERAACVWADLRALRHILGHVLTDAIRATREGDWIEITLAESADGLAVVIQDEGEGLVMPDGPGPAPRESRGIGLRLALARELMQAHGGRMEIEAQPGVGSRITLHFPAARVRGAQPAVRAASYASAAPPR